LHKFDHEKKIDHNGSSFPAFLHAAVTVLPAQFLFHDYRQYSLQLPVVFITIAGRKINITGSVFCSYRQVLLGSPAVFFAGSFY